MPTTWLILRRWSASNLAATFLATYRVPFMAVGIAVNAIAVTITVHKLREEARQPARQEPPRCGA